MLDFSMSCGFLWRGGEADDNYVKVIFDDVVMVMRKMNHPL